MLDADEVAAVGLIGRVVDDAALDGELATLLERWRSQPTAALRAAKTAVDTGMAPLTTAARAAPTGPASDRGEMTRRVRDFLTGGHTRQTR